MATASHIHEEGFLASFLYPKVEQPIKKRNQQFSGYTTLTSCPAMVLFLSLAIFVHMYTATG